ncbi:lectin MOA-related protein [bacterium]|nr:lectin MOA-related protein [bacterium]
MINKLIYYLTKILSRIVKIIHKIEDFEESGVYIHGLIKYRLKCNVIPLDGRYKLVSLDTWKKIIQSDTLNLTKKWHRDVFDCDDFAIVFKAHVSEFYEINSVGVALGRIYDAKTSKYIGYHAYNLIVAKNGNIELYVYEPQTDELVKAEKRARLGNCIYETDMVII